jgi:DNA-3-methyladenine glycosylase II
VDLYEDGLFRKLTFVRGNPLLVEVTQMGPPSRARLQVTLRGSQARSAEAIARADIILRKVLGARTKVRPFYERFRDDPLLGGWIRRHLGLRVAGRLTVWETLIQIVLSQQIHLKLAHDMQCQLAENLGRRARFDGRTYFTFPSTRRVASLRPSELRKYRLSRAKSRTLVGLARAFESRQLSDERLEALPDDEAIETLISFPGVGRWTAEFTLLRGLGRLDVFPGGDLGVVKYLAQDLLGHDEKASEEAMRAFAEKWRPYRGLALIHAYAELSAKTKKPTG